MAPTGQVASHVLQRMQISGSIRCGLMTAASAATASMCASLSMPRPARSPPRGARLLYHRPAGYCRRSSSAEAHVLEVQRLPVDADGRRCDPAGVLAGLDHTAHEGSDEREIL